MISTPAAAAAVGKAQCITCGKEKSTIQCQGCLQLFCYNHIGDHRKEFTAQLEEIDTTCNQFQQTITKLTMKPQKHPLFQQIDQWERDSIQKIQQSAEEARQILLKHLPAHVTTAKEQLKQFTSQVKESREENDFFETDIQQWMKQLIILREKLRTPSNIVIELTDVPLVTKISVDVFLPICMLDIDINAKWSQNGIVVAGNNKKGNGLNQLSTPQGLCIDDDQTIYITDHLNHRIMAWVNGAMNGQIIGGGKKQGNRNDQLNNPIDIIIDKENDYFIISDTGNRRVMRWPRQNPIEGETVASDISCYGLAMGVDGCLYVSDCDKHEVRQYKTGNSSGTVIAGGNGPGDRLDQFSCPTFIFVDHQDSLYISDHNNHRVMKWIKDAKEGIVVAGGQGQGNSLSQLSNPAGIVVDQLGTIYVADNNNKRVMRWLKGATQGSVIVLENKSESVANQLSNPCGLSLDRWGNLYITNGHRVQKFDIDINPNI